MRVNFLGTKSFIFISQKDNSLSYTIADQTGNVKKIVKHTSEPDGFHKREILSAEGKVVEVTTYKKIDGKKVNTTYDSDGHVRKTSIIDKKGNETKSIITDFMEHGMKVSRMLSIEKRPSEVEISEVTFDNSGHVIDTNYRVHFTK